MESFKSWLKENEINESWKDLALAGALTAGALTAQGANSPMPINTPTQNQASLVPQVRTWIDKENKTIGIGHLEKTDRNFVYIRMTKTPTELTKIAKSVLSNEDSEYAKNYEDLIFHGRKEVKQPQSTQRIKAIQKMEFDPDFGPQPKFKNANPIQIWKYQLRFIQEEERKMRLGRRPSIDYILLYKKYGGKMPEPPLE